MDVREIKFRALELDTAIVRYGSYVAEDGYVMCNGSPDYDSPVVRHKICEDGYYCDVVGDTVGQYTGLKDKNGVEIYEGDVLRTAGVVTWNNEEARWSCVDIEWNDRREWHDMLWVTTPLEVIGNIYENQELLNG